MSLQAQTKSQMDVCPSTFLQVLPSSTSGSHPISPHIHTSPTMPGYVREHGPNLQHHHPPVSLDHKRPTTDLVLAENRTDTLESVVSSLERPHPAQRIHGFLNPLAETTLGIILLVLIARFIFWCQDPGSTSLSCDCPTTSSLTGSNL
ncbi:hypothetical protein C8R46DRAFT_1231276 [Mycena filopes]|nr:hypothetical protein C8R46DRAFT_1231276 [Mycena filopes]